MNCVFKNIASRFLAAFSRFQSRCLGIEKNTVDILDLPHMSYRMYSFIYLICRVAHN